MLYDTYKHVLDLIPKEFKKEYETKYGYGEWDYTYGWDSRLWLLAAAYIDHLHKKLKETD